MQSILTFWFKSLYIRIRASNIISNKFLLVGAIILTLYLIIAIFADIIAPYPPIKTDSALMLQSPSLAHPFGTDRFGRDLLSRTVYGTRVSLSVAFASIGAAVFAGSLLGLVAAYLGKAVDQILGRVMDIFFALPSILLAIAISAILGTGRSNAILAIAIVYMPSFFRVMRGSVLSEKEKVYVEAARAVGASPWYIMFRQILRNVLAPIYVQAAVSLSYAILLEAALSFLGVGVQPPTPSWGTILNEGRNYLEIAPWISIFPGVFIMLSVLSFNFIFDGLRDIFDPRLR
ncbi:MAG: ABC transporter permease [Candidatus Bipolaricaulia bacterium]